VTHTFSLGRVGSIEVICGSMFSGKSEELIRRLVRALIAKQRVGVYKPLVDHRYDLGRIVSHSQQSLASETVQSPEEILERAAEKDVVGIDEVQFLGSSIVGVASALAAAGKRVIVAGLDTDFRGRPFEPMPDLLAVAEHITKTLAICMVCGGPANRSQRKSRDAHRILVGASDLYEARCRHCFEPPEEE